MSKPSDLVQGTLDLLLLKILALEPMHGWAVSQRLTQVSGNILQVSDGSLYPALHKLEQERWITAEWKASDLGPPGKVLLTHTIGPAAANERKERGCAPRFSVGTRWLLAWRA